MADSQIPRQKRVGKYTPERIKTIEPEIAAKYAADQSAKSLSREYGISKNTVLRIAATHGIERRGKQQAGELLRTRTPRAPIDPDPTVSIAMQVARAMGYDSSAGLSKNRKFRTAAARECAARNAGVYRRNERKRKEAENRIPAWQCRKQLDAFWAMANDFGLEVDHIISLQGEDVWGLNVISNLQLLSRARNQSKQNKCDLISDYMVGPPRVLARVSKEEPVVLSSAFKCVT